MEKVEDANDKQVYLKGTDYTHFTRTGKAVRLVRRETKLFMREGQREWDKWEGYDSGIDTWSVGGGECTAHIICSMQSSVPPLPFTRLLKDVALTGENCNNTSNCKSDEPVNNHNESAISECVIKVEKVDVVEQATPQPPPVKPKDQLPIVNSENTCPNEVTDTTSLPSVHSTNPSSVFTPKINRKNNAKTSKLDDILKRIKKDTPGSSSVSIFNKNMKVGSQKDSMSILDQILNQDKSNQSETSALCTPKVATVKSEVKGETKLLNAEITSAPSKVKSPLKSPSKLLIISSFEDTKDGKKKENCAKRESNSFKRPYADLEGESWSPDEASLSTTTEGQDWLAKRVMATGTVIRNLSFVPGNEDLMSHSAPLLALLGKTILLHHNHPRRAPPTAHYDRDEETDFGDWCSSLAPDIYWWWPYLHHVHENTLVILANIAGHLDLSFYPEEISRPILDGLLHWATCPASYGQDPLPGSGNFSPSSLSTQRLALEALVKLCVLDHNTDLVLATPPFGRIDQLCMQLTRLLCRGEDQVLREFSINLFHYFSAADSGVARVIALQNGCVSLLLSFIEEAESAALNVATHQGVAVLKENPELMGTSLDMVRRSANTLVNLSRVPDNARVIMACENRFLNLVMSQILDTYVASQLSQVLFNVAQVQSECTSISSSSPISPSFLAPTKESETYSISNKQEQKNVNVNDSAVVTTNNSNNENNPSCNNNKSDNNNSDQNASCEPVESGEEKKVAQQRHSPLSPSQEKNNGAIAKPS